MTLLHLTPSHIRPTQPHLTPQAVQRALIEGSGLLQEPIWFGLLAEDAAALTKEPLFLDGSDLEWTMWAPGQPDGTSGACVAAGPPPPTGGFKVRGCSCRVWAVVRLEHGIHSCTCESHAVCFQTLRAGRRTLRPRPALT